MNDFIMPRAENTISGARPGFAFPGFFVPIAAMIGRCVSRIAKIALGAAFFAFGIFAEAAFAQEGLTAKSLEGVWKVTKVVQGGVVNANPQPGVLAGAHGAWACTLVGECSTACPKGVDPAGAIQRYKLTAATQSVKQLLFPRSAR